jgi:hypothetical protein
MKLAQAAVFLALVAFAAAGCASSSVRAVHRNATPASGGCGAHCTPPNQPALDSDAGYAQKIAGEAHVYTGAVIDDAGNHVVLYLSHAPESVLAKLRAAQPGIYLIHNDAPRTLHDVMQLMKSHPWFSLKAKGIDVNQVGPTQTGYLQIGVSSSVADAQAYFDAKYGSGVIRVIHTEPATAIDDLVAKPRG